MTGVAVAASGANGTAVGYDNAVSAANSAAVGTGNSVTGTASGAFGVGNRVKGNSSYALGDPNLVNGNNTAVVGNNNTVNGPAVAGNGDNVNVLGSGNAVASTASANGALVGGKGSTVNAVNAVALGTGSTTTGARSVAGNAATGVQYNAGAVAAGSGNVASVGAAGAERQIQNVAAGAVTQTSTDAVNGSQLYAVATNVNTLGTTTAAAIGGGATYAPTTGITGPNYTLNGSGATYTTVVSGIQALANGAAGPVQYTTPGVPSNSVNLVGTGGPVTLGNVAAGRIAPGSTQAVNGNQAYMNAASVAAALGGGSVVNRNGTVSAPSYQIGNATYNNTGDALSALQANTNQSIAGLQSGMAGLQNSLSNLQSRVNSNYQRANGGIAAAIATAGLRYDDRPGKISTGAAISGWNGELGVAGGIGATSNDGLWRVNAAFALSPSAGGHTDVGAVGGVTYTWN